MNNLKYSIFDLFSYAIPGSLLICCIGVANNLDLFQKTDFNFAHYITEYFSLQISVIFLILSYLIGFITNIISNYFIKVFELIFPIVNPKHSQLENSTKFILIRELAPTNFKYIEKWNSLKSMASNLALIILIDCIILKVTYFNFHLIFLIIGIGISGLLIALSFRYKKWIIIELDNTVHYLGLDINAQKYFEAKLKI